MKTEPKGLLVTVWVKLLGQPESNDPLLMQSVYQQVFEDFVTEYFARTSTVSHKKETRSALTSDEMAILRYACCYVSHSLLKRFEKRPGEKYSHFVFSLREMAVSRDEKDVLEYTQRWIDIVNRGGFFSLNDTAFTFYVEIEKIVRDALPKHAFSCDTEKLSFQANVYNRVKENEDVQFYWAILSQEIDNPDDSQELLAEIIKLWVTVRRYAMTATWMETFKKKEEKTTQKSTGLRKSISGSGN